VSSPVVRLDPRSTAVVAIDMHRGHLDPAVATLPLPAERCGPLIKRAAALFADVRALGVPVVHVVTEYGHPRQIAANPFWKAAHDDPTKARRGILSHNLVGGPGVEIIPELLDPRDVIVRGKKRYSPFQGTDPRARSPSASTVSRSTAPACPISARRISRCTG